MAKRGHCIFHYGHNKCSLWQYTKGVCVWYLILESILFASETTENIFVI